MRTSNRRAATISSRHGRVEATPGSPRARFPLASFCSARCTKTDCVPGSFTVRTYSPDLTMPLDAATVRNLELPALVSLMDRASTPVGARQLRAWMGAPLRDAESIQLRLAAVDELVSAPGLRDRLQAA